MPPPNLAFEPMGADPRADEIEAVDADVLEVAYQEDGEEVEMYPFPDRTEDERKAMQRAIETTEMSVNERRAAEHRRVMNKLIPASFVQQVIDHKKATSKLYKELLLYIPFLCLFITFLFWGRSYEAAYRQTDAVGGELAGGEMDSSKLDANLGPYWAKHFEDVNTPTEFYDWFNNLVIPFLWDSADAAEAQQWNNFVVRSNYKIGTLRVRAIRYGKDSCSVKDRWYPTDPTVFTRECYDEYSPDFLTTDFGTNLEPTLFKFNKCTHDVIRRIVGKVAKYECSGNVFDIPFNTSRNFAAAQGLKLQQGNFIDTAATRFAVVEFFTYNAPHDQFANVKATVEITSSGSYIKYVRTFHFEVWSTYQTGKVVFDMVIFAYILYFVFRWTYDLVDSHRNSHRGVLGYVCDIWNFLEFVNLIGFLVFFGVRFAWMAQSDGKKDILAPGAPFDTTLDYIAGLYQLSVYFTALNCVLCFLKVLKYVKLNPRFNILTRTMAAAQQNLIGLLAMFVVVLMAYSITATVLFGNGVEDFRDLETSFSSLMRMLLGDFEYEVLRRENRFLVGLFFWSFMILGLFLLLNFMIAVIGDGFEKESGKVRSEPLYDQLVFALKRLARKIKSVFKSRSAEDLKDELSLGEEEEINQGRLTTLLLILREYRHSLPVDGRTDEEVVAMSAGERRKTLPDPLICRSDLNRVIADLRSRQVLKEFTETYLDNFWYDAHKEFFLMHDESSAWLRSKRHDLIQTVGIGALRDVLKDGAEAGSLFSPGSQTTRVLETLQKRIDAIEAEAIVVSKTLCAIDVRMSNLNTALTGTGGGTGGGSRTARAATESAAGGGGGGPTSQFDFSLQFPTTSLDLPPL